MAKFVVENPEAVVVVEDSVVMLDYPADIPLEWQSATVENISEPVGGRFRSGIPGFTVRLSDGVHEIFHTVLTKLGGVAGMDPEVRAAACDAEEKYSGFFRQFMDGVGAPTGDRIVIARMPHPDTGRSTLVFGDGSGEWDDLIGTRVEIRVGTQGGDGEYADRPQVLAIRPSTIPEGLDF